MKRIYSFIILALMAITIYAHDAEIDGVFYNLIPETKEASVTFEAYTIIGIDGSYSGSTSSKSLMIMKRGNKTIKTVVK